MTFRRRLVLASALAVAAAVVAVSGAVYVVVRSELRREVDRSLRERAAEFSRRPVQIGVDPRTGILELHGPPRGPDPSGILIEAVSADGVVATQEGAPSFAAPAAARGLARTGGAAVFEEGAIGGVEVRTLSIAASPGIALILARDIEGIGRQLARLRWILLAISSAGIAAAALLGGLVARSALAPVRRLTAETELVTRTQDLAHRIEVTGSDELSRLGASFNEMLGALDGSLAAQRQLVADASHELRTPLTSLRTNIEVLARTDDLAPDKRSALLRDLTGQLEEMSALVSGIVEAANDGPSDLDRGEVALDELVAETVERVRRLSPDAVFATALEPCTIVGVPTRIERAVANLLDNAIKWSPPGSAIDVAVAGDVVTVRDRGPGIDAADLPHVFDRFYRAAAARPLPGSGLGLAIVKQVADEHGATVTIESPPEGGTVVRVAFVDQIGQAPLPITVPGC